MPTPIQDALKRSCSIKVGEVDDNLRKALAQRFGARFRVPPLRASENGAERMVIRILRKPSLAENPVAEAVVAVDNVTGSKGNSYH